MMNNSYLYVIGGSYWKNDVLFTPINSNGTLGIWQTTTSFITGRWAHTSVVHNDFVYVLGGTDNSERNDVQFAPINSNGSLGNWQLTTSFIIGRDYHSSVVHNGYIYVIGGLQSGGELCRNDVQFAPINFDGTLGTWQTTTSFATERLDHTSVVYNGYLYIIGGREFDKNSQLNDVQFVLINSDGTLGTWQTTTSFNISRSGHTSVVQNGYLYILGGYDGNSYRNDVEFALINSNGTLGTWHTTTSFGTGRHGHTSVVYNNYLYVIGGYQGAEPFLNDVQYTQFF